MKVFNILLYVFGITLPIILIISSFIKPTIRKIIKNIFIAGTIFACFYILKLGGDHLMNKDIIDSKETEEIATNEIKTSEENESTTTMNEHKIINKDGLYYIDGYLIVNKTYPLPDDYVPTNTYKDATGQDYCPTCLDIDTYENYKLMEADAKALGLNLWIQSGYRSYNLQTRLYNDYVSRDGKSLADTYSARPGHSEHQTGLAFDLNTITDSFAYTDEGKWVDMNAYKYGFILRYPKSKEEITGYKYEPWHLRYVGKELAEKLYNNGDWITLEEYFNLTSTYSD